MRISTQTISATSCGEAERKKNKKKRVRKIAGLKLEAKKKAEKSSSEEIKLDPPVAEKEKLPSIIIMALRNLKIIIKRIHVRYEDDYYAGEKPFSFGLMIDVSQFPLTFAAFEVCDSGKGVVF